jgi:hypothetical protein
MPYDPSNEAGNANYRAWIQIPDGTVIPQGSDSIPRQDKQYALIVYSIAGGSVSGSNTVTTAQKYAAYVVTSGSFTYLAEAVPGSTLTSPVWRAQRIESLTNTIQTTWADGNSNFDNAADDLNGLSYS